MDSSILVQLRQTKTKIPRIFTIVDCNNGDNLNFLTGTKKYIAVRPKSANHLRFFLSYKKGKCSMQPVGKNTMGKLPSVVAKYLKLPNPEGYTGHCFRRSSATLLADSGADLLAVKLHGGWRSSSVAEGYIEESVQNKIKIARRIVSDTSTDASGATKEVAVIQESGSIGKSFPGVNVSNCNNFTFGITLNK